jgi:type III pantothenate kinase
MALVIGNSRLHWAMFKGNNLQQTWDTPHVTEAAIAHLPISHLEHPQSPPSQIQLTPDLAAILTTHPDLWIASVVPQQTALWQGYPNAHFITLQHIPLQGLYPTLGIDRALALWGAVYQWQAPALVIDAGTALTFTSANTERHLIGGAILPGMQLQLRSLSQHTAALPLTEVNSTLPLPSRWASETPDAIRSGVIYGLLATIQDFVTTWLQAFPEGAIACTGGDSLLLVSYLQQVNPELANRLMLVPHLVFYGMPALRFNWS